MRQEGMTDKEWDEFCSQYWEKRLKWTFLNIWLFFTTLFDFCSGVFSNHPYGSYLSGAGLTSKEKKNSTSITRANLDSCKAPKSRGASVSEYSWLMMRFPQYNLGYYFYEIRNFKKTQWSRLY